MRWDDLFDDLAGQGDACDHAAQAVEIADRARHEQGRAALVDGLRGWPRAAPLTIGLPRGQLLSGPLLAVGADWLALLQLGQDCVVPLTAVRWIQPGAPTASAAAAPLGPMGTVVGGPVQDRLRLTYAVRCLARDRAVVRVQLVDGESVTGTVDEAGLDHLKLARHPAEELRRAAAVHSSWWVPFAAMAAIHGGQVWSDS